MSDAVARRRARDARRRLATALLAALTAAAPAAAQRLESPPELRRVAFEQRLGEAVDLDLVFTDSHGRRVRLGELLEQRPIVLVPVYYECPMLCALTLNGLTQALKTLDFAPGREFDVVVYSIDPEETPEMAARQRAAALERYGGRAETAGWHFLTGSADASAALSASIGFGYDYVEETGEWAHAAGIVLLTPAGRVARYFYGIEYPPRDLRLGLVESSAGGIGSLVDQVLLYCYRYDPTTGRYSAVVLNMVRLGGAVTVAVMAILLTLAFRSERLRARWQGMAG